MITGFKRTCSNGGSQTSGVTRLLVAPIENITSITMDTVSVDAIKAVVLKTGTGFAKYEFFENECEFKEDVKVENGITSIDQKVVFKLPGMSKETRTAVEEIKNASYCGLAVAVVRKSGIQLVGYDADYNAERPLRLATVTGTTGKKLTDASGEEITLSRETTVKAHYYVGEESALMTAKV